MHCGGARPRACAASAQGSLSTIVRSGGASAPTCGTHQAGPQAGLGELRGARTRSTTWGRGNEAESSRLGARLAIVEERLASLKGMEDTLARIDQKLQ